MILDEQNQRKGAGAGKELAGRFLEGELGINNFDF